MQIVVMDKLDYCATRNNVKTLQGLKNFKFVKGDIQSIDLVSHVLERENVDTIMHFAAQVRIRSRSYNLQSAGLSVRCTQARRGQNSTCMHARDTVRPGTCSGCATMLRHLPAHAVDACAYLQRMQACKPCVSAMQTHVDNSFGNSLAFTMNNTYGTHVLLEAARKQGRIRRFINVSTDEGVLFGPHCPLHSHTC